MTLDDVRLAAHERAMQTDPAYRSVMESIDAQRRLVENLTLSRRGSRRRALRRMWSTDNLSMPRAFFSGPRWKRLCGVQEIPIAAIDPIAATYHRPGRKLLVFTFEEEIRERICEQLRFNVYAQWSDPREWESVVRPTPR